MSRRAGGGYRGTFGFRKQIAPQGGCRSYSHTNRATRHMAGTESCPVQKLPETTSPVPSDYQACLELRRLDGQTSVHNAEADSRDTLK